MDGGSGETTLLSGMHDGDWDGHYRGVSIMLVGGRGGKGGRGGEEGCSAGVALKTKRTGKKCGLPSSPKVR